MYQVGIVTLSDKGAKGERQDLSGPKIQELLPKDKYEVISYTKLLKDAKQRNEILFNKLFKPKSEQIIDLHSDIRTHIE